MTKVIINDEEFNLCDELAKELRHLAFSARLMQMGGRVSKNEKYYSISGKALVPQMGIETGSQLDDFYYDSGNYFINFEDCEKRSDAFQLLNKMWAWAQRSGDMVPVTERGNGNEKYSIYYDYDTKTMNVRKIYIDLPSFTPIFYHHSTAEEFLDNFEDELLEIHRSGI